MKELLDKLSSYNLFNYLLPGAVFAAIAERLSGHAFHRGDLLLDFFTYYFIGLVISRVGSLVIQPFMTKSGLITTAPYSDYCTALSADPHLEILSEQNNTYRTLCALFVVLAALIPVSALLRYTRVGGTVTSFIVFVTLCVLFALAYRKQTRYVKERVEARVK